MGEGPRSLRILVTGGQGFLGGALLRALVDNGYTNVATTVRRPAPELEGVDVEVVRADLGDLHAVRAAVAGRDLIFHTAARAGVWGDEQLYWRSNVEATGNLLQAAHEEGVRYLVHTSSPSVTFQGCSSQMETEAAPYGRDPLNAYCRTKIESERQVLASRSVRTLALRPHLIYGPGDPHLLPRVFDAASRGRLFQVGDGDNLVDVTHISDVVACHLQALTKLDDEAVWGEAYFVTSGVPIKLWDWLNELLEWRGLATVSKRIPLSKAVSIGRTLERLYKILRISSEPPLTEFSALQLGTDHTYSIDKARTLLGYQPKVDPYAPFADQFGDALD